MIGHNARAAGNQDRQFVPPTRPADGDRWHTVGVRIALIINPFASSVDSRRRVTIQRRLAERHDLTVIETTKGGHAVRLAHGARRDRAELIIALGGDGTINEVVNGVLGTDTLVAPLPGGSTNVFARALGYPNDPVAATDVLLDAIDARSWVDGGVGLADDRAFLFNLGIGFDAAVVGRVERRGALKRYAGHPLFVAATVAGWLRHADHDRPWFTVATDDGRSTGAHLAIALNCDPYTYLGNRPLTLAPEATLTAPLAMVGLRSLKLTALVPTIARTLMSTTGVADGDGGSFHWSPVTEATITADRPVPYQLDGEYFDPVSSLTISYRPSAVRLVVPPPTDR